MCKGKGKDEGKGKGKGKSHGSPGADMMVEISLLRRLQGDFVVKLVTELQASIVSAYPMMVMELCQGTLKQEVRNGGLGMAKFLVRLEQICKALVWLHSKRVVHADIKSDNLLLSNQRVVFGDFGCSKDLESPYPQTGPWGAPEFHCWPDVDRGYLDIPSDLWMLAQCAYEVWTGEQPWWNPCQLPLDIPVRATLERCLENDENARPTAVCLFESVSACQLANSRAIVPAASS